VTGQPATRATWLTPSPIVGFTHAPIHFDGSQSARGRWSISFGDGTPVVKGNGVPPAATAHRYTAPGNYTATLTVVAGGVTTTAQARTTIIDPGAAEPTTKLANPLAARTATLNGHAKPNTPSATAWFEWGTNGGSVTHRTAAQTLTEENNLTADLTGLTPSTTYWFRVVARNKLGTVPGRTVMFTTPAA
jgi:PKD repeat protein